MTRKLSKKSIDGIRRARRLALSRSDDDVEAALRRLRGTKTPARLRKWLSRFCRRGMAAIHRERDWRVLRALRPSGAPPATLRLDLAVRRSGLPRAAFRIGLVRLGQLGLAEGIRTDRSAFAWRTRAAEAFVHPPGLREIVASFEPRDLPARWRR